MRLRELLKGISGLDTSKADLNAEIRSVTNDSRRVAPGSLFVALKGTATDGHRFVKSAISNGAYCVVCQDRIEVPENVSCVCAADTAALYPQLVARMAGDPNHFRRENAS